MATHKSKRRQSLYNLLSKQVNVAVEGELAKSRAALLVWFLSVVKGFDEADAVEFICDGDGDGGIDGLLMETHETDDGNRYVVTAFQSKYPHQPSMVGEKEIAEFIARGERLQNVNSLRLLVEPSDREELRRLVERFRLEEKIEDGTVTFKLHFVTAGHAGGEARKLVEAHNHSRPDYVKVWDIDTLGPAIESYSAVAPAANVVCVPVSKSERLLVQASDYRTSVAAVRAQDIVQWPGIEDRSLFNLNVRRQLPANRVRSALDRATTRQIEHDRFLASHNGITVICRLLEVEADRIVMHDPSVVNGAQSIIAFFDNQDALT
ncbi:MAG: AIPR family protein, partial [Chloroflexota bacterium]|nr:AIPR family protein [Chloroflexota bacterium]